jgi:hypothetical protein
VSAAEHHGSESYFVLGEGLLGEAAGGRERTLARTVEAEAPPFRFSRMGPGGGGRQPTDGTIARLGEAMAAGGGGSSQIPAGYTYLGQFIDHDLTFDKTSVTFGDTVSAAELLQARSPSLDLDSLYGAGPSDPASAGFYAADGLHLKMGKTVAFEGETAREGFDLPRGAGSTRAEKRKAIIPDPRNDENLAVAQTHLALIRFHNRVVDSLSTSLTPTQRFNRARRMVTRHYQWMIRTDFLPRICAAGVVNDVFNNNQRKAFEVGVTPTDVPTMPIEFSVAAYRLGHSMIRQAYNWNSIFDFNSGSLDLLFRFSGGSGNLDRQLRLASIWIADFRRLYDFGEAGRADLVVPAAQFNRTMRIDTKLVDPLRTLPRVTDEKNLAVRNLMRAKMVRLATGQQMATFLRSKGVAVTTLTRSQIRNGNNGAALDGLTQAQREAVLRDTPLWFYILREAELGAGKLRGVGARIVAETFHRAMEGSQVSIVRDPTWRPTLGPDSNTFRMVDLLLFAFAGRKNRLAPLG